ncbi:MAG: Ig-like domain-containing protein [Patescibacteria group bacterium]
MFSSRYRKGLTAVTLAGLFVFAWLAVAILSSGPRVRFLSFTNDPNSTSSMKGELATFVFDRPIQSSDYSDLVRITPDINHSVRTDRQSVSIVFNQNLRPDTEYTVELSPGVESESGKRLSEAYAETFITPRASYAYVTRNYPANYFSAEKASDNALDSLTVGGINGPERVIFEHPTIIDFDANSTHAVVSVQEAETDLLYVVDIASSESKPVHLGLDVRISYIRVPAEGNRALYRIVPNPETTSDEIFKQHVNRVESLDLESLEAAPLRDASGDYLRTFVLDVDDTGSIALVQDNELDFYAVSPYSDFEPVLLGNRNSMLHFSGDGRGILFRDTDDIVRYDLSVFEDQPLQIETSGGFILAAEETDSGLYYALQSAENGVVTDTVYLQDDGDTRKVWSTDDRSDGARFNSFSLSIGSSLVVIETRPLDCLYDNVSTNSSCPGTRSIVLDIERGQTVHEVEGIGFTWLP